MEKKKESIVLALIALIIGILALILSWVPIVNNFAAILAVIGFILAIIALIINRKNKKTLSNCKFSYFNRCICNCYGNSSFLC
ncbi:hypothetical protein ICE98_00933 [Lactococcus lactis]|nr:hypothetical protein [Lactococcus lactis]